jgi:hypothetical protein
MQDAYSHMPTSLRGFLWYLGTALTEVDIIPPRSDTVN